MPDKKLTDNEIKSALKCAILNAKGYGSKVWSIEVYKLENTLDLINRLQAQNKDLAETVHNLTLEKDALFDKAEELKAEIERLKNEISAE